MKSRKLKNKRVNYFKGGKNMETMKLSIGRIFWMVTCLALILSLFLSVPSYAKTAKEINGEVSEALALFYKQVKGGKEFLNASKGVLVIPNIVKAGLGVGGQYGEGALRIGGKPVGYYSLAGGSAGLQIGAQKMNLILVFTQDEALKKFRASSGWKAGVDASVAFVDVGAEKSFDTVKTKEPIVGFVFGQKGAMAAATVEGAKFTKLVR
jgi:lipid-binding SYLF domain-containing protein